MNVRTAIACAAIFLVSISAGYAQSRSLADKAKIEAAIENWNTAWKIKDAKLASKDYSDDASWTNAFGMKQKGRNAIEKTLTEVFALPFVMEGSSKTVDQVVEFIRSDVATVVTRVEREGQKLPSGEMLPTRQTSHLRVFKKLGMRWVIVSHLISDAREMERKAH